jgi:hypothetical protein
VIRLSCALSLSKGISNCALSLSKGISNCALSLSKGALSQSKGTERL